MRETGPLTVVSTEATPVEPDTASRRGFSPGLAMLMFGSYALIALLVIAGVWMLITQDRLREKERQETEMAILARSFEEHVSNSLGRVDLLLDSTGHLLNDYLHAAPQSPAASIEELRANVSALFAQAQAASALAISGQDGKRLLSLRNTGLPASITPPTAHIAEWAANPSAPMRIGTPLAVGNNDATRWQLPVERAAVHGGKLHGVVSALINARHFERYFSEVRLQPSDSVMLLRQDGILLLQVPFSAELLGRQLSGMSVFAQPWRERAVVYIGRLRLDEEARIIAVRKLGSSGALIVASRPLSVALREFTEMRRRLIIGAGLMLSALLALTVIVYGGLRRRERDRAELRRINATLEARVGRRTAELEQTNRELLAFSYSVSHDLRTPLRAINGFAYALREDYQDKLDDAGRDFLDRIYRASVRMGELIDELLSLANISRQPLNFGNINISALASDVADELRHTDPHRAVRFDIQPEMRAEGDETLMRNALTNLLGNAWKFTRSRNPAFISITARDEIDRVRYTVGDNGVGFDMAHSKRLFQPFQQLHADQGYGGTGIGLASVRRIIERHGGRIWAESSPDRGARFVFELPKRIAVVRKRRSESTR